MSALPGMPIQRGLNLLERGYLLGHLHADAMELVNQDSNSNDSNKSKSFHVGSPLCRVGMRSRDHSTRRRPGSLLSDSCGRER